MSRQLTVSNIKELVTYDPVTGVLLRTCHWNSRHRDDMKLGYKDNYGYLKVKVGGVTRGLHQLAWFIMTGDWPQFEIDHINGDPSDNRWENLRDVNHQENLSNRKNLTRNNSCGCIGVSYDKTRNKYRAYHTQHGKQEYLGRFNTVQEAINAREAHIASLRGG